MAGPFYVQPGVGNDGNAGTAWGAGNSWATLQKGLDTAVAGEIVYCRGTETLGATIDCDTQEGSEASGFIKIIGCNNSDGSVDGTRYVVDGDSTAANCVLVADMDYYWWENIEFTGATGAGFNATNAYWRDHIFVNCISHDNGGDGFDLTYNNSASQNVMFIRCQAYNNVSGWGAPYGGIRCFFCIAKNNTADGFEGAIYSDGLYVGCIAHNNGVYGFDSGKPDVFINCIADENDDEGIDLAVSEAIVIGCRITDNGKDASGYGLKLAASKQAVYGWNFIAGNATGQVSGSGLNAIPYDSDTDTNETSGTEGYSDDANDDLNLTTSATLRSVAIALD